MFGTLFAVLFVVAIWHYVCERVLVVSWRDKLRHELFALRDDLRSLKTADADSCPDEVFAVLDAGIGRWINSLSCVTPRLMYLVRREYMHNDDMRAKVDAATRLVEECGSEEVRRLADAVDRVLRRTLVCNCLGLSFCFLPPVLALLCLSWGLDALRLLLLMPREGAERFSPRLVPT